MKSSYYRAGLIVGNTVPINNAELTNFKLLTWSLIRLFNGSPPNLSYWINPINKQLPKNWIRIQIITIIVHSIILRSTGIASNFIGKQPMISSSTLQEKVPFKFIMFFKMVC